MAGLYWFIGHGGGIVICVGFILCRVLWATYKTKGSRNVG